LSRVLVAVRHSHDVQVWTFCD